MTLRNIPLKVTIVTEKREAEDLAQIVRSHGFFCEIALAEKCNTRIRKPGKHVSIGLFIVNDKTIWSFYLDSFTRPLWTFNFIYIVTLAFNFLYPSFIPHVLEIENATFLCNLSVYYSRLQPGLFVQECLYQLYSY